MNNCIYKLKNLIVCLLVFCLLIDTVFITPSFAGNEVNTDSAEVEKSTGSMAGDTELFYDDARGQKFASGKLLVLPIKPFLTQHPLRGRIVYGLSI